MLFCILGMRTDQGGCQMIKAVLGRYTSLSLGVILCISSFTTFLISRELHFPNIMATLIELGYTFPFFCSQISIVTIFRFVLLDL